LQKIQQYKRQNFGRSLPMSALMLIGIGVFFSVLIYKETGWNWHVPMSLTGFGLFALMIYLFYRKGNEIIEITPDKISVIAGGYPEKTIFYSEIESLKYTDVSGYIPPTIELKDTNCKIGFNAEMSQYPEAVKTLFYHLIEKGREDLIHSYKEQFEKTGGIKT